MPAEPMVNVAHTPHHMRRFVWGYVLANTQAALEYRASFVGQVVAMLLNDIIWLIFWLAYFSRFALVAGWGRNEIITLWAVTASAFGLGTAVCGNASRLASLITRGQLDFYLSLPKPVLLHVLISTMSLTAPGDVAFGLLAYCVLIRPTPLQLLLFGLCATTGAIVIVAFMVLTQSLAFWLGNAEGLGQQLIAALINFSTYPTVIFHGAIKVILFTLIPAGFIAYVPVQLLRAPTGGLLAGLLVFTAVFAGLAISIFYVGLRRYESGNLVMARE